MATKEKSGRGYASLYPDERQREEFLELIAAGETRQEAAAKVGSTSSRFRSLMNGRSEESLAFAERYLAILTQMGKEPSPFAKEIREAEQMQLIHRLLDEAIVRALDSEKGKVGSSNRMLYQLALLKVDDFKPLLEARTRHIHEGSVGVYAMPQIDSDKWSLAEHKEFVELRKRMNELLELARPDGQAPIGPPALEAGDEVIDQVAVEVA